MPPTAVLMEVETSSIQQPVGAIGDRIGRELGSRRRLDQDTGRTAMRRAIRRTRALVLDERTREEP